MNSMNVEIHDSLSGLREASAIIGYGWKFVKSARSLKAKLLSGADALEAGGKHELAALWKSRLRHIPKRMGKEAINAVLLAALMELDKAAIAIRPELKPTFGS